MLSQFGFFYFQQEGYRFRQCPCKRNWHVDFIARGRRVQANVQFEKGIKVVKCSGNPVVLEVEVGVDFLDIGGRLDVGEPVFTTAREADVTSDCTIDAVDGKISGPRRSVSTSIPIKKLEFSDLRG